MDRILLLGGLCAVLLVSRMTGAPVEGPAYGPLRIEAEDAADVVKEFKAGEPARAIVAGDGSSFLGLYVYDADGNCVARDDHANDKTSDKAAVDWFPAAQGRFTIEVRNLGRVKDASYLAIH